MLTMMESKQHTQSVIARLIGLDELPPHQPFQKKRRVLSENYLRRVASIGVRQLRSSEARPSFRFGIAQKKEFKDVFETLQKFRRKKDCNQPVEKGDAKLSLSKEQIALWSQNFGDAKCVSEHKWSQISKEDYDEVGLVGSKMDLFVKYLQEPDSTSCKHPQDLQGIPRHSQSAQLKSLHASDCAKTCMKSERGTDHGSVKLLPKLPTGLVVDSHGKLGVGKVRRFLRSQTKSNNGACLPSTKIVVLKPIPGKTEDAARYLFSSGSLGDSHSIGKKHNKSHSPESENSFSQEKKMRQVNKDVKPVRRSRFSKDIEGQRGHGKTSLSTRLSKSGIVGNDTFAKESELMIVSFPRESQHETSFYPSEGSYLIREAKKDILHRWKTNKKFQEVEVTIRGRTLGEVLAMPDPESRDRNLDVGPVEDDCNSQIGLSNDRFMRPLESASWLQHSHIPNKQDVSESLNSLSGCMKSQSFPCLEARGDSSVQNVDVLQHELKRKLEEKDDTLLAKDDDVSYSVPNTSTQQAMSFGISEEDSISSCCSRIDPESLSNSEEAYQPSPNSVLEPAFDKDVLYSSECFRGVNTSLHGLQLQLELLKSVASGMIVSSDDDSEKGSVLNYEENEKSMKLFSVEERRDYSYLVDVFNEAGFHGSNLVTNYDALHSPEFPISPQVFEMLEKKYGEQISWKRLNRRLLFDRINSELMEILKPSIGTHWTKPVSRRLSYRKSLEAIEEAVWISLVSQEEQADNAACLKVMGNDDGWLGLGDDMDGIVREIENSLIDELATEVSMESF